MKPFHLPKLMRQHRAFLLVTSQVEVTTLNDDGEEYTTTPVAAGLYGYPSIEARDRAKSRLNRTNSEMVEVAFPVEPFGM